MRFAISLPQAVAEGGFDRSAFHAFVTRADELGFESLWTQEQVLGTWSSVGPIETMAFAAALTERLRLGCAVFVSPLHSPVHLAKSISSLDQLTGGRLEVGIGAGGRNRPFSAFGLDSDRLVARFTEGLKLMKELWTQSPVTFHGEFWQVENGSMEPKPLQQPYPPIWFGGSAPAALRRAARYGDGFFGAGSTTTANFAKQVPIVRGALAEFERAHTTFGIAKRVYIDVDENTERSRQRVQQGLRGIYGDYGDRLLDVAVWGPPEVCIEHVRAVVGAGAELILFTPLADDAVQMERLAVDVIPRLVPA
jgi:probable F420-dependent oxidoreductase